MEKCNEASTKGGRVDGEGVIGQPPKDGRVMGKSKGAWPNLSPLIVHHHVKSLVAAVGHVRLYLQNLRLIPRFPDLQPAPPPPQTLRCSPYKTIARQLPGMFTEAGPTALTTEA
jgi:hypothetical protein